MTLASAAGPHDRQPGDKRAHRAIG